MTKCKKWIVTLCLVALVAVVIVVAYYVMLGMYIFGPEMTLFRTAYDVHDLVSEYIRDNDGNFPPNWEAVSETGRLKWIDIPDGRRYFYGINASESFDPLNPNSPGWRELLSFDQLEIKFDFSMDNIQLKNERLVSIDSGEELLLIDGAYKLDPNCRYWQISAFWFELMTEIRSE